MEFPGKQIVKGCGVHLCVILPSPCNFKSWACQKIITVRVGFPPFFQGWEEALAVRLCERGEKSFRKCLSVILGCAARVEFLDVRWFLVLPCFMRDRKRQNSDAAEGERKCDVSW